jgi:hypothetical protein
VWRVMIVPWHVQRRVHTQKVRLLQHEPLLTAYRLSGASVT